ncbi:MAG: DUF3800 domain-containing protein [Sphingomonas adhaesiva]|uniref:DUF3800 domain-containing protein n=1 Tax=Sphingomonas adhaesiva TaxID=28212 RepID=UPI002FF8EF9F
MLYVYVDESENANPDILVLSGVIGSRKRWKRFTAEWKNALKGYRLDTFHTAELFIRFSEDESRRREVIGYFRRLIGENVDCGVSVIVSKSELDEVITETDHPIYRTSYGFLLYQLVILTCNNTDFSQEIQFVFDEHSLSGKIKEVWSEFVAQSPIVHQQRIRREPIFLSDANCEPLQAADFLAWRERRLMVERITAKPDPMPYDIMKTERFPVFRQWCHREYLHDLRRTMENPDAVRMEIVVNMIKEKFKFIK